MDPSSLASAIPSKLEGVETWKGPGPFRGGHPPPLVFQVSDPSKTWKGGIADLAAPTPP